MENKNYSVEKAEQNVQPSTSSMSPMPHFAPGSYGGPKRIIKKFVAIDPNKIKKFGIENMIADALNKLKANQRNSATILNTQHKKQTKPCISSSSSISSSARNKIDDITIKTPTLNSDIKYLLNKKLKEKAEQNKANAKLILAEKLKKEREKKQQLEYVGGRDGLLINKSDEATAISSSSSNSISLGKLVKSVECAVNKVSASNISKKACHDDSKTIIITDLGQKKKERKVSAAVDSNLKFDAAAMAIEELRLIDVQRRSTKRVPTCTITAPPKQPVDTMQVCENTISFDFSEMKIKPVAPQVKTEQQSIVEKYNQTNSDTIKRNVVDGCQSGSSSSDEFCGFTDKEVQEEQVKVRRFSDLMQSPEFSNDVDNKAIPSFSNLKTYLHQKKTTCDTVHDAEDTSITSGIKKEVVDDIKTIIKEQPEEIDEPKKKKIPPIRKKAVPVSVLKLSKKGPVVSGKVIKNDSSNQKTTKSSVDLAVSNSTSTSTAIKEELNVSQSNEEGNNQTNKLHTLTDLTTDRTVVLKVLKRDPQSGNIKFEVLNPLIKVENVEDAVKDSSEVLVDSIEEVSSSHQQAEGLGSEEIISNNNNNYNALEQENNLNESINTKTNDEDGFFTTTENDWQNDDDIDNDVDEELDRGEKVLGVISNLIKIEEQKSYTATTKTKADDTANTFILKQQTKPEKYTTKLHDDQFPIKQKSFARMSTSTPSRNIFNNNINNDNIEIINKTASIEEAEDAVDFLLALGDTTFGNNYAVSEDSLLSECDSIDFDGMDYILGLPQPKNIKQEQIIKTEEIFIEEEEQDNYSISPNNYQRKFIAIPSSSPINQSITPQNIDVKPNNIYNNDNNDDDTDVESPDFEDIYENEQLINNNDNNKIMQHNSNLLFDQVKQNNTISYSIDNKIDNNNLLIPLQQRKSCTNSNLKPIVLEDKILSEKERIDIIVLNTCDFIPQNSTTTTTEWQNRDVLISPQKQQENNDNNIIYLDNDLPARDEVEIVSEATDLLTKNTTADNIGQTIIVTGDKNTLKNDSCDSEAVKINKNIVEDEENVASRLKLGQVISMDLIKVEENSTNIVADLNTTISLNDNNEYKLKHKEKFVDLNSITKSTDVIEQQNVDISEKNEDRLNKIEKEKDSLLIEQTNRNKETDSTSLSKEQNKQDEVTNPPKKVVRKKIKPVPKIFSALKAKFSVDKKLTDKSKTINKNTETIINVAEAPSSTTNNKLEETTIAGTCPVVEKNDDKKAEDTTISSISSEIEITAHKPSEQFQISASSLDVKADDKKEPEESVICEVKKHEEINFYKESDTKPCGEIQLETLKKDEEQLQAIKQDQNLPEIASVTKSAEEDISLKKVEEVNVSKDSTSITDKQESSRELEIDTNTDDLNIDNTEIIIDQQEFSKVSEINANADDLMNADNSVHVEENKEEGGEDRCKEEPVKTSLHSIQEEAMNNDTTTVELQTKRPKPVSEEQNTTLSEIAQAEKNDSDIVEPIDLNAEDIANTTTEPARSSVVHIFEENKPDKIGIELNKELNSVIEPTSSQSPACEPDDESCKSDKLIQSGQKTRRKSKVRIASPSFRIPMKDNEDILESIVKDPECESVVEKDENEVKSTTLNIEKILKNEDVESCRSSVIHKSVENKHESPVSETLIPADSDHSSHSISQNVSTVCCDTVAQNTKLVKDKSKKDRKSRSKITSYYLPQIKPQEETTSSDVSSKDVVVIKSEEDNNVEASTTETNKTQEPVITQEILEQNPPQSSTLKSKSRRPTKRKQEEASPASTEAGHLPPIKRIKIDNDSSINPPETGGKTRSGRKVKLTQKYIELNFNEKKPKRITNKKVCEESTEAPLIVFYQNEGNSTTETSASLEKNPEEQLIIVYDNGKNDVNENVTVITTNLDNQISDNDDNEIILPPKKNRKRKYIISDDSEGDAATPATTDLNSSTPKNDTLKIAKKKKEKNDEEPVTVSKRGGRKPRTNFDDIKLHPRLLLVTSRDELDKEVELPADRPLKKGEVKCGLCKEILVQKLWKKHIATHYGVGWKENVEKPLDVESYRVVYNAMVGYFKNFKPNGVKCKLCGNVFKSGGGICYHLLICNSSEQEKLEMQINCEHCEKLVSKLTYTLHLKKCKVIVDEDKEAKNKETSELINNRFKRKSLIRAEQKLKAVTKEVMELEKDSLIKTYLAPRVGMLKKWNHQMKSGKDGNCPGKDCTFSSSDLNELRYHYSNCDKVIWCGFTCVQCKFLDTDKDVVWEHVKRAHGLKRSLKFTDSGSEADLGSESSDSDVSGISDVDDEKEKKGGKKKKLLKKECRVRVKPLPVHHDKWRRLFAAHNTNSFVKEARADLQLFRSINYSPCPLFNYAVPSRIDVLPDFKFNIYKPYNDESMRYCYSNKRCNTHVGSSTAEDVKTLDCFKVEHLKNEKLMYIGGPVTALSWIPLPDDHNESQYLALSYKKDLNHYTQLGSKDKYKTLILICKIGLAETFDSDISNPSILYGIPIDTGPVYDIQFLPSGGYAPEANRLGLMAVANSQTDINIYSLPLKAPQNCDKISDKFSILDIAPSLILTLSIKSKWKNTTQLDTKCVRMVWSQSKGHNVIVAGYTNGFVAIWDISEDDNLNRFQENDTRIFLPYKYFCASSKSPTGMDLHYDNLGPRWLAYVNQSRDFLIFDLHDLTIMSDDSQRHSTVITWPLCWENLIVGLTDDGNKGIGGLNAFSPLYIMYKNRRAWKASTGVADVTFNPWQNYSAFGLNNGDILFQLCYNWKHDVASRVSEKYIAPMDMIRFDGEPMTQYKLQTKEKIPLELYESDYKSKYAIVFYPIVQVKREHAKEYASDRRLPFFHFQKFMKINRIAYNINKSGRQLVAAGYENGFLRIHKTNFKLGLKIASSDNI